MIYRKYGKTGIDVSAIGFGGMRFEDQEDVDGCASLVKAAYDKGINYFDTAPGYGKSEELFGVALKEMLKTRSEKPFYVSTKSMKSDPADIRKDLETSLERMNLDYIDFYHFWYIMMIDEYYERKAQGALDEFERLKDEGLIKHICVSTHMPGSDIAEMLADYPFEGMLLGYSVMNFAYRDQAITAAAKNNLGVAIMNPLGGGFIPKHPELFQFAKSRPDETVVQGALRFLINDPRITITLVGFSTHEQIDEAISAVDGYEPIPPETVERIHDSLQESFNQLCTSCRYCRDVCPEGIPVERVMGAYNLHSFIGTGKDSMDNLKWHWGVNLEDNNMDQCTECCQCEEVCTQKLPIRERMKAFDADVKEYVADQAKKEEK